MKPQPPPKPQWTKEQLEFGDRFRARLHQVQQQRAAQLASQSREKIAAMPLATKYVN